MSSAAFKDIIALVLLRSVISSQRIGFSNHIPVLEIPEVNFDDSVS